MVFNILNKINEKKLTKKFESRYSKKEGPTKYAILFNADSEERFSDNITLAFRATSLNDYLWENTFVFEAKNNGKFHYPIWNISNKRSLENTINLLSKEIGPEDTLFLYMTGHGKERVMNGKEITTLPTPRSKIGITEKDVADYLSLLNPKNGLLVYTQCYSGGFSKKTGNKNYVSISSCKHDESSYGGTFSKTLFEPLFNKKFGNNANAQEIFNHVLTNDPNSIGCPLKSVKDSLPNDIMCESSSSPKHSPQIYSEIDPRTVYF